MCHIDFGFIFGDDPKKKFVNPPPFRITKSMVDAMGGQVAFRSLAPVRRRLTGRRATQKGEYFYEFCRKSVEAYKELRNNAALIMSLLRLMKDAGIEVVPRTPGSGLVQSGGVRCGGAGRHSP
jgi:phosphatidylinositol kinase/protein kinase (PI-3  family)